MTPPELRFTGGDIEPLRCGDAPIAIGRGAKCDRAIVHPTLSYRHAEIRPVEGGWALVDLGSTNGTAVDGVACQEPQRLYAGSRVRLGTLEAVVHGGPAKPHPSARPASRASSPSPESRPPRPNYQPMSSGLKLALGMAVVFIGVGVGLAGAVFSLRDEQEQAQAPLQPPPADPLDRARARVTRAHPGPEDLPPATPEPIARIERRTYPTPTSEPSPEPRRVESEPSPTPAGEATPRPSATPAAAVTPAPAATPAPDRRLALALGGNDAGLIARLLRERPEDPQAERARARLQAEPVFCLRLSGTFAGGGDAILLEALPLRCEPADLEVLRALEPAPRVVELGLRLRYRSDYTVGLGRRVGKQRLAPHPKAVSIELRDPAAQPKAKPLANLEGETDIAPRSLAPAGLSEREVWEQVLAPLADELREALLASAAR